MTSFSVWVVMQHHDSQLYLLNAIRARVSVITNTGLTIVALMSGITSDNVITERIWYGVGALSATAGLVGVAQHRDNKEANDDVITVSDQVRTNKLYNRLMNGDTPMDYSKQAYNYIVMQLGNGVSRGEILSSLDSNPVKATQLWEALEKQYGSLPTGML